MGSDGMPLFRACWSTSVTETRRNIWPVLPSGVSYRMTIPDWHADALDRLLLAQMEYRRTRFLFLSIANPRDAGDLREANGCRGTYKERL
jgi:hypothetical protein